MDLNLAGKVAVVTGAGKGIGMATTRALAGEGAQVVAGSLTTDTLDGLKGVTPGRGRPDRTRRAGAADPARDRTARPHRRAGQQRRSRPHAHRGILRDQR